MQEIFRGGEVEARNYADPSRRFHGFPAFRTAWTRPLPMWAATGNFSAENESARPVVSFFGKLSCMVWAEYFSERGRLVIETAEFLDDGVPRRQLARACETGKLVRVRPGHYVLVDTDSRIVESVRAGGLLACRSAATDYGIFSFEQGPVHVHSTGSASRLRSKQGGARSFPAMNRNNAKVHWGELMEPSEGNEYRVGLLDAIRQTFLCQHHRLAMATLENALYLHRITEGAVPLIFSRLPARLQYLRWQVDERSESGQETVLRLILREAGFHVAIQVSVEGVGRVDMVVEGVIVVEADSRQFHDGWESHARDRKRDVTLAGLGYMSLRVLYQDIMFDPQCIILAVRGLLYSQAMHRTGTEN